jgi:hypothetical protein
MHSRRTFVASTAALLGTATVGWTRTSVARTDSTPAPVPAAGIGASAAPEPAIGFHNDRPYFDPSGTTESYLPPAGLRGGAALARLSEVELLSRYPYLL